MIYINGDNLTIEQVIDVVRHRKPVSLDPKQTDKVNASQHKVHKLLQEDKVVYGITTGFGKLADTVISQQEVVELQQNLILSHSSGVGTPLAIEVVKAMMLLRANALMKGHSGIRLEVIKLLIEMLNKEVIPVVPSQGSVGASGDLVPLAHLVLVMLGQGEANYRGETISGKEALDRAGMKPVVLQAKEGLALINGTQCMTALGTLGAFDGETLLKVADVAAALTMEALAAIPDAFDDKIHELRPHPGQLASAYNVRKLLTGSGLVHRANRSRVQDAYSIRCVPQVHGASRDTLRYVQEVVLREINSVTDNPLIFTKENQVLSAGNFHGQPVALSMDFLGIALAELANISERRIERLVNPTLSGLPAFLTTDSGKNSGYMIAQYTAASLVSENKVLSHPASVDSIPTSANQEDHVSMGTIAARKMYDILTNTANVLAIELLCAAQAVEFSERKKLSPATLRVYRCIRQVVPKLVKDRMLAVEIKQVRQLIHDGSILRAVQEVVGPLK